MAAVAVGIAAGVAGELSVGDGIELGEDAIPDETTILNFRHLLETHDLCKGLFTAINADLAAVLKGVAELDFGTFDDSHIDLFGDAYEFLISNYAANAGKSGGEFFTPVSIVKLIVEVIEPFHGRIAQRRHRANRGDAFLHKG